MKPLILFILTLSLLFSCSHKNSFLEKNPSSLNRQIAVSNPFPGVEPGTLFSQSSTLHIQIKAPFTELFRRESKQGKKKTLPAKGTLSYVDDTGATRELEILVSRKGFSTLHKCPFPKLEIEISKKLSQGTLFEKTKSVDLNTHCADLENTSVDENYKESYYNHREATVYRFLDILGIPTLRTRKVWVQYIDSQEPDAKIAKKDFEYQAFFLEDMAAFRKRLNVREIKGKDDFFKEEKLAEKPELEKNYVFTHVLASPQIDVEDLVRMSYFQTMISNVDWFIKMHASHKRFSAESDPAPGDKSNLWNIKIVETENGEWVVFPYDFNLSGLALAKGPFDMRDMILKEASKELKVKIKQTFIDKKADLYYEIQNLKNDSKGYQNAEKLLNHFFNEIENL